MPHGSPPSAHFIGACGAGMKALAELLSDAGWRITGSDEHTNSRNADRLRAIGVTLHTGHRNEHVPAKCNRVVYSPAVGCDNVERRRAAELGLPQQSLPEFLGDLTRERTAVCIAGTHGKSTTTGLIGWILAQAGRTADVYCGAEVIGLDRSGWRTRRNSPSFPSSSLGTHSPGSSASRPRLSVHDSSPSPSLFLLESCEYRRHFLHYRPQVAVLLGVEWDHVDCFASLEDTITAFAAFLRRVPADGTIVYNADCPGAQAVIASAWGHGSNPRPRLVPFGLRQPSIPDALNIRDARGIRDADPPPGCDFRTNLPGGHNILNALAAAAACRELGLSRTEIDAGLKSFRGVRRRLQHLGEWRGMTLIDDYAHHPTAVARGLETLRSVYPRRPLRVVFQPHQVRRTRTFLAEFAEALSLADAVYVLPPYGARESAELDAVAASQALVERIASCGGRARRLPSLDPVATTLETDGRPGDVCVLMGAGSIERVADEFAARLRRHHAG